MFTKFQANRLSVLLKPMQNAEVLANDKRLGNKAPVFKDWNPEKSEHSLPNMIFTFICLYTSQQEFSGHILPTQTMHFHKVIFTIYCLEAPESSHMQAVQLQGHDEI